MSVAYTPNVNSGRRFVGVGMVLLLHVLIVYALVTGLARKAIDIVRGPLETKLIEEVKVPEPPPPPPKPQVAPPKIDMAPPPAYVPPPAVTPPASTNAISAVSRDEPPPGPPPAAVAPPPPAPVVEAPKPPPVRVAPELIASKCKKADYPAASRRMEEEGTVIVRLLVGVEGKITESKIEASSGYTRLDEAARNAWSACMFKPGTLDGKPDPQWVSKTTIWKLETE